MSPTRQIYELAKRDFLQRAKSKAFLMSMLMIIGIVAIIGPLISLTNDDPEPSVVGLIGDLPNGSTEAILQQAALLEIDIELTTYPDIASAEQALTDGDLAVAVNGLDEVVFLEGSSLRLSAAITGGIATAQRQIVADDLGLSPETVGELLFPVTFTERTIEPPNTDQDEAVEVAALIGLMLLYISILIFGQFVMMGVMEEKQTRVVEVVLSRVKPTQVLVGKVLGIGLLGLIQIIALGVAAIFTLTVADLADIDASAIGIKVLGLLILWYLLGYTFYSFMYGALGATISRQEDMQGVAMLPVLMILPGFFLGQMALIEPGNTFSEVASFVPLWSPMVMAVRSTTSDVPIWQVLVSVALIVLTTILVIKLGGRIYRGAILQSGSKTKLRTAWRSASTD